MMMSTSTAYTHTDQQRKRAVRWVAVGTLALMVAALIALYAPGNLRWWAFSPVACFLAAYATSAVTTTTRSSSGFDVVPTDTDAGLVYGQLSRRTTSGGHDAAAVDETLLRELDAEEDAFLTELRAYEQGLDHLDDVNVGGVDVAPTTSGDGAEDAFLAELRAYERGLDHLDDVSEDGW